MFQNTIINIKNPYFSELGYGNVKNAILMFVKGFKI
jgi:hypothetical protein